jgi:hypothetical protein
MQPRTTQTLPKQPCPSDTGAYPDPRALLCTVVLQLTRTSLLFTVTCLSPSPLFPSPIIRISFSTKACIRNVPCKRSKNYKEEFKVYRDSDSILYQIADRADRGVAIISSSSTLSHQVQRRISASGHKKQHCVHAVVPATRSSYFRGHMQESNPGVSAQKEISVGMGGVV